MQRIRRDWLVRIGVVAGLIGLLAWGVALSSDATARVESGQPARSDVALFSAVSTRLAHGEPYYQAMGQELAARNYPTGSIANWRTPLYLQLAARAPWLLHGLLWLLGGFVVLGTAWFTRAHGRITRAAALLLQIGAIAGAWSAAGSLLAEPLTGILIALSVFAALQGSRTASVVFGAAALFIRELAAPYVAIRLGLALWRREHREAAGWGAGLAAYAVFYLWHAAHVYAAMPPKPAFHAQSWVHMGGVPFLLETLTTNAWLVTASPLVPLAFVAALVGAWRSPLVLRLPILGYFAVFAIVGLPFNGYWGWVPGVLLPLAWAQALHSRTPAMAVTHS